MKSMRNDNRKFGAILRGAALLLAGLAAVSACTGRAGESGAGAAGKPVQGGELRFGLTTEPATLDPLSPRNTADGRSVLFNVFEGLVKSDTEGNLRPAAAESWAVDKEARVYTFTLREGLLFSDGSPVRASDAVFSLNEAARQAFAGFSQIEKVEALDGRRFQIILKESDPEFLPYLTIGIVPEANGDREKNPIGSGPFVIESYTPQRSLVLVKNPRYWREGLPHLDRVVIPFVADTDALLLGLKGGGLDGATLTGSYIDQIEGGGFDIFTADSASVQLLALNNAVKPLDNALVRQALSYAVDAREIIDTAFFGRGEPSGSPLIPGLASYYDTSLRSPYPADTGKAKALLARAGLADGFPLEITVPSNYTMHVDTAQVIVNQLERVDVKATIRLVDWATWLSEVYQSRKYQATVISLDANNVSPRSFLSRYRSGESSNFINFSNADYDRVFDTVLTETDAAKRTALYKEAQRVISENAASVYIQDIKSFHVFAGGRFGGLLNYPLYVIDFASVYRIE